MSERTASAVRGLSAQEQFDFRVSRRLPKFSARANRLVYRVTGGRAGASKRSIPIGLLTTTGRQSGRPRTTPIMYLDDGARFLVVASNSGFDAPPAWYLNLSAHRDAEFRTRSGVFRVHAHDLDEDERTEVWDRLVRHNPLWGAFQSCTDRTTTVVALEHTEAS